MNAPANTKVPRCLTIAGSDSGGGAGIQADLKTFTALGVFGMSALTAVTAQNTCKVHGIVELPPEFVRLQIEAVVDDIGVDAVKTGMLSSVAIIEAVAEALTAARIDRLVVDPVMVAKGGDRLLREDAQDALAEKLLPLAAIVTPNVPEAEALAGLPIRDPDTARRAAERIHERTGCRSVLVKGGHLEGYAALDILFDGREHTEYAGTFIDTKNTHGTGCTYASAIAAFLARGLDVKDAIARAKAYLTGAIENAFHLGSGHGPLNHFWTMRGD